MVQVPGNLDPAAQRRMQVHLAQESYRFNARGIAFCVPLAIVLAGVASYMLATDETPGWIAFGFLVALLFFGAAVWCDRDRQKAAGTLVALDVPVPTSEEWLPTAYATAAISGVAGIIVAIINNS